MLTMADAHYVPTRREHNFIATKYVSVPAFNFIKRRHHRRYKMSNAILAYRTYRMLHEVSA